MNKDWIKINRVELLKYLGEHYNHSSELAVVLPDKDAIAREQARREALTYKGLINEIEIVCGNKEQPKLDNV